MRLISQMSAHPLHIHSPYPCGGIFLIIIWPVRAVLSSTHSQNTETINRSLLLVACSRMHIVRNVPCTGHFAHVLECIMSSSHWANTYSAKNQSLPQAVRYTALVIWDTSYFKLIYFFGELQSEALGHSYSY